MSGSCGSTPDFPAPEQPGPEDGGPARPASGHHAIERIASAYNMPKELVQWEFWSAWDALLVDAKCADYLLVLTEKRVIAAIRRRAGPPAPAG